MRRRNSIGSQLVVVFPSTLTSPAEGSNSRLTSFKVVVFPQPDSPSRTRVSPRSTIKLRSVMMFVPESVKLTLSNSTIALWALPLICCCSVGEQQITAETFLRVEPRTRKFETCLTGERADAVHVVLVGILCVNQFARAELDVEIELLDSHALVD